jgi:MFS family permease
MERSLDKARRRQLFSLRLAIFVFGMSQAVMTYRVAFLQAEGLTATQTGIIISIASAISIFSPMIGGMIADKLRSQYKVFVFAITCCALICAFIPASAKVNIAGSILTVFLIPLFQCFMPVASNTIETTSVNAIILYPNVAYSTVRMFMPLGYLLAGYIYTPIAKTWGLSAPFYFSLFYFAVVFIVCGSFKNFEMSALAGKKLASSAEPVAPRGAPQSSLGLSRIFKSYYLVIFLILNIVFTASSNSSGFYSYLITEFNLDPSLVGAVSSTRFLGEMPILLALPWITRKVSLSMMQIVAASLFALELLLYRFCTDLNSILAVAFISGLGWGSAMGTSAVFLRTMAPEGLEATTAALWNGVASLGSLIMTVVFGRIIDTMGMMAVYKVSFTCEIIWLAVFLFTYFFGKYVLKQQPPVPLFKRAARRTLSHR